MHLDDLNYERRDFHNMQAYGEAKVATTLYAMELGERLKGTGVTTASVHPGWARSNFGSGGGFVMNALMTMVRPVVHLMGMTDSSEESAQTSLRVLLSDDAPRHSGAYFSQSSVLYRVQERRLADGDSEPPRQGHGDGGEAGEPQPRAGGPPVHERGCLSGLTCRGWSAPRVESVRDPQDGARAGRGRRGFPCEDSGCDCPRQGSGGPKEALDQTTGGRGGSLEPGEHVDRVFEGVSLTGETLRGASYEGCTFRRCRVEESRLADCRFTDCVFEHCEFISVRLPDCSLVDVVFRGGRAMGVDFSAVRDLVLGMSFEEVAMDYSNFTGLPLKKTVFRDCRLREASFSQCDLSGASFAGCDLSGAVIQHAKLVRTDFEGATRVAVDGATCTLQLTRLNAETARYLLRDMGVLCSELGIR